MRFARLQVVSLVFAELLLTCWGSSLVAQSRVLTHRVTATVRPFSRWVITPSASGGPPKLTLFTNDPELRLAAATAWSLAQVPTAIPTPSRYLADSSRVPGKEPELRFLTIASP